VEEDMKEIIIMIRNMDMVYIFGQVIIILLFINKMINLLILIFKLIKLLDGRRYEGIFLLK
jgi:hypothetical protein